MKAKTTLLKYYNMSKYIMGIEDINLKFLPISIETITNVQEKIFLENIKNRAMLEIEKNCQRIIDKYQEELNHLK